MMDWRYAKQRPTAPLRHRILEMVSKTCQPKTPFWVRRFTAPPYMTLCKIVQWLDGREGKDSEFEIFENMHYAMRHPSFDPEFYKWANNKEWK